MARTLFYWIIGLLAFFVLPSVAFAAGEFDASYDVHYAITTAGLTIVTQNITLTNKLTNLYPKEYTITIDSDKIKNVIASDGTGIITPGINLKDGKTEITLAFNERVVGLGQKLAFSLRYENGDVAHQNGAIWEVNIPGVENDPDLQTYRVSLSVPPTFGPVAYLSPQPQERGYWTKDQMVKGGISAAYGSEQTFDFTLSYYLANPTVGRKQMDIALPPETAYQDVLIRELKPEPKNVSRDSDGNWLATYELLSGQKLDIQAHLLVTTYLKPKNQNALPIKPEDYLKPTRYWEVYDAKILALAKIYRTPRDIYNYVVSTLSYDYNRVNENPTRRGAIGALASPKQAICMEFTDLFVALSRAAGIPAREVVGYAYTTNSRLRPLSLVSDVLHAWPEYYDSDKRVWVPVDPTWANTTGGVNYFDKLDFNHVAFAIHGISSEYPYPAGFYRSSSRTGKDIEVSFSQTAPTQPSETLSLEVDFPKKITAGFSTSGTVVIHNGSGHNIAEANIFVDGTPGNLHINKIEYDILPYGNIRIPISIRPDSFVLNRQGSILITANGQTESFSFTVAPLYVLMLPIATVLFAIAVIIWFFTKKRILWKLLKH